MKLKLLFTLSIFLFFSCRQIPENERFNSEKISSNNPVCVKIKFLGIEYNNNILNNSLISENNSGGGGVIL